MKNLLVLVKTICVLIINIMGTWTTTNAQPTNPGQTIFEFLYGGGQANAIISASISADNSSSIIVGKLGTNGAIQKTSASGSVEWAKKITGSGSIIFNSVAMNQDGGCTAMGTIYGIPGHIYATYVTRFNQNGDTLWQFAYCDDHSGDNSAIKGNTIVATPDGGCLIAGTTDGFAVSNNSAFLMRLDSMGNVYSLKVLNDWSEIYSIQKTNDGGYILAGNCNSNLFLLRLDSSLNNLWAKTYGGEGFDYGCSVKETYNNEIIAVGNSGSFSSGYAYIVKTDQYGDTLSTKLMGLPARTASCVAVVSDGTIISGNYGGTGGRSYLAKLNTEADSLLWSKVIGQGSNIGDCNYSIITNDNNIFAVGSKDGAFSFTKTTLSGYMGCDHDTNMFLVPVPTIVENVTVSEQSVTPIVIIPSVTISDYVSDIDTVCFSLITGANNEVLLNDETKIYPNPATNYLTVTNAGRSIFSMFNSFGELVFQKKLNGKEEVINFDLPGGIYFYTLGEKGNGKVLVSK